MDSDFSNFVSYLWQNKPIIVILFAGIAILVLLIAIDAYRHRKKQKKRTKKRLY
jgi:hypothetical protein